MPELPEVQTVVNGIKSKINKHKILRFKKYISKLRYPIQKKFIFRSRELYSYSCLSKSKIYNYKFIK